MRNMWQLDDRPQGRPDHLLPRGDARRLRARNRGKHVLTQRPDGRPQCIACNMCATVCPAKVHRDRGRLRSRRPGASRSPRRGSRSTIRAASSAACASRPAPRTRSAWRRRSRTCRRHDRQRHVARPRRAAHLESAARRRQALPAGRPAASRHARSRMIESLLQHLDTLLLYLFAGGAARRRASLMLVLRHPMRVAIALISTMLSLAGVYGAARRALHRRLPGADLRRRGDGVHGLRDHAARRARRVVPAALFALLVPGIAARCSARRRSPTASWRGSFRASGARRRVSFGAAGLLGRPS